MNLAAEAVAERMRAPGRRALHRCWEKLLRAITPPTAPVAPSRIAALTILRRRRPVEIGAAAAAGPTPGSQAAPAR
jgi:hypothetical protein